MTGRARPCPLLLLIAGLSALPPASRLRHATICSVLLRDGVGRRLALVDCRADSSSSPRGEISLRRFAGLYGDVDAWAAGSCGRFWILGSWLTSLLTIDATSARCVHLSLRRFDTEVGGYRVFGLWPVTRDRLFVGQNYGDIILNESGVVVASLRKPARVLYRPCRLRYRRERFAERDDVADVTRGSRLEPAGIANGLIAGFSEDYFSLMDATLRQRAAFEFPGSSLLAAAPLQGGFWLILGRGDASRRLWSAVVDARGRGAVPQRLPSRYPVTDPGRPFSAAATGEQVWVLIPASHRSPGLLLAFRRADGHFLRAHTAGQAIRLLAGRGPNLYLVDRADGGEKLAEVQGATQRTIRSWQMPCGPWHIAALTFMTEGGR